MDTKNLIISGFKRELSKIQKDDLSRRGGAKNILDVNDVSGEYNAKRLLQTTLKGELRAISARDLQQFAKSAKELKKKFKGGITAQDVIDLSLPIDRQKANADIPVAAPMQAKQGVLHFITNASRASEDKRHHVHVEFTHFAASANSPDAPSKIVKEMIKSPVRFDCDCGRHAYWFRYIATTGNYNYGRPENGFPKIRNPNLVGVACKHVLRVMQGVKNDARVRSLLLKMVEAARSSVRKTVFKAEIKDAKSQQREHLEKTTRVTQSRTKVAAAKTNAAAKLAIRKLAEAQADAQKDLRKSLEQAFKVKLLSKAKYQQALKAIGG